MFQGWNTIVPSTLNNFTTHQWSMVDGQDGVYVNNTSDTSENHFIFKSWRGI